MTEDLKLRPEKRHILSLVFYLVCQTHHVTLMSVILFSLTLTRQTDLLRIAVIYIYTGAMVVSTDSHRFNLCHFVSLRGVTSGWGNRGTACGRQEGGDKVRGGQSEAPKGSERGM